MFHSWYQGALVNSRKTRGVTEAVALNLLFTGIVLGAGVLTRSVAGLIVAWIAFDVGAAARMGWLWWRSRSTMREVRSRDGEPELIAGVELGNW